jgi:type II secretory pathway component PulJ
VERVLELYWKAPETPARSSRLDRRLAEEFLRRGELREQVDKASQPVAGRVTDPLGEFNDDLLLRWPMKQREERQRGVLQFIFVFGAVKQQRRAEK